MSENTLYKVVTNIIKELDSTKDTMVTKGFLAKVRQSIKKPYSQKMFIWGYLGSKVPSHYLSNNGDETHYERTLITVIEIYALLKQGTKKVNLTYGGGPYNKNIGKALHDVVDENTKPTIDKRVTKIIATKGYTAITYYLTQTLKMVKGYDRDLRIDFGQLAQDLYLISDGRDEEVKIRWARAYYK